MKGLVKYQFDYADEFDVYGLHLVDDVEEARKEKAEILKYLASGKVIEKYFGTNEAIIIDNPSTLENGMEIIELTDEEADVISRTVGDYFGFGLDFDPDED